MITRLFLDHPRKVDESYFEHFTFAMSFAGALLLAGCAALVHALIPALFEKTAGNIVLKLHGKIVNRGR